MEGAMTLLHQLLVPWWCSSCGLRMGIPPDKWQWPPQRGKRGDGARLMVVPTFNYLLAMSPTRWFSAER